MTMRPELEIEMISVLQFYARPATYGVRFEEQLPSEILHDQGEKARVVLAKLGITDH